jgi:hypothetical protein
VQLVWDYFDYTQDAEWYQQVGYPLLKGVVQFWLETLVEDEYFKDGTLVSNPCFSPEHGNAVGSTAQPPPFFFFFFSLSRPHFPSFFLGFWNSSEGQFDAQPRF